MSARCYVCGSTELAADADLRSPTCEECKPARAHVVSNQTAPDGGALAVCPCGWTANSHGKRSMIIRETKVRLHWRSVISRSASYRAMRDVIRAEMAVSGLSAGELALQGVIGAIFLAGFPLMVALFLVAAGATR